MEGPQATATELEYVGLFVRAMKDNVTSLHKRELFLKKMMASLGEEGRSSYNAAYGVGLYKVDISFQKIFAVKALSEAKSGAEFRISKGDLSNAYQSALRHAQLPDKANTRGFAVAFCRFLAKNPAEFLELRNKVLGSA